MTGERKQAGPGWTLATLPATILVGLLLIATAHADAAARAKSTVLENGLELVVISDRRAPIVTHMIWYRVGAADDPAGKSGLAHFLEHLMFKATKTLAPGELSRRVNELGGNENALTTHDATVYHQRVAKEHLAKVMALEADRMINLQFSADEVAIERNVVLEERRQRIGASPLNLLSERINAALYQEHPYAVPVLGWPEEIAALEVADARSLYQRAYGPSNAIVLVAGDVSFEEALRLTEATYGQLPATPRLQRRAAQSDLPPPTTRRVTLSEARASSPTFFRAYRAPSAAAAIGHEAAAIEVLARILAQGETSRLFQRLVREKSLAVTTEGGYRGGTREGAQIAMFAIAARGIEPTAIEREIDAVIAEVVANGITDAELDRARSVIEAKHTFESDAQLSLAMRYGEALAIGRSITDIESFPDQLAAVTCADVQAAAAKLLLNEQSVTGWLLPAKPENRSATAPGGRP